MKKLIFTIILLIADLNLASSGSQFICGISNTTFYRTTTGGLYKPSQGNLVVPVIFVQFSDDTTPSTEWPITTPRTAPSWMNNYISGLNNYFTEMSNGNFTISGNTYHYVPQNPQSSYSLISEVNQEALISLDGQINFANLDNFTGATSGSDSKVDMIIFVYRNFENRLWTGNSEIGWSGYANFQLTSTLTLDGVQILSGFDGGSGIQQRGGLNGYTYSLYVTAHEYGHHLFGSGHIENVSNLALMTGGPVWNASRGMHSWERQKMGWINFTDKSTDTSVTIADYITANQVYRVPLPGTATEYFLIENRKKQSTHDWAGDIGFYIYHVTKATNNLPTIDVECADGNWNFNFDQSTKTITRLSPNSTGTFDEMNVKYSYDLDGDGKLETYACYTPVYNENSAWGDTEDAFDLTFNI